MKKLIIILLIVFLSPVVLVPAFQFWIAFQQGFSEEFGKSAQGGADCRRKGYTFEQSYELGFKCP